MVCLYYFIKSLCIIALWIIKYDYLTGCSQLVRLYNRNSLGGVQIVSDYYYRHGGECWLLFPLPPLCRWRALTRLNDPMPMWTPPLKWMCVLFCLSSAFVAFAMAQHSLGARQKTPLQTEQCLASWRKLHLLVNLITVSDSHATFDEADYGLIKEGQRRLLQEHFSVAQLRMHLLWKWHVGVKKKKKGQLSYHFKDYWKNTTFRSTMGLCICM